MIPAMPASMLSDADPREGSRDTSEGIIVSETPDVCLTPMGGGMVPLPYQIWARQQDVAAMADTVRQTDMRTHVRDSLVLRCYGDEPGTGGGMISGTTGAECTPKTWSGTVFAQGRNVVRHDDEWWMNHRNTYGRLYYTKDMGGYASTDPNIIQPMLTQQATDETSEPVGPQALRAVTADGDDAGLYKASMIETMPGNPTFPFGPQQYQQGRDATGALLKGLQGLAPEKDETWQEYLQRPLYNLGIKKKSSTKTEQDSVRTTRAQRAKNFKCPQDRYDELSQKLNQAKSNVKSDSRFKSTNAGVLASISCQTITDRMNALKALIDIRQQIQDECYKDSPDPGHEQAITDLKRGLAKAQEIYNNQCLSIPAGGA